MPKRGVLCIAPARITFRSRPDPDLIQTSVAVFVRDRTQKHTRSMQGTGKQLAKRTKAGQERAICTPEAHQERARSMPGALKQPAARKKLAGGKPEASQEHAR